MKKRKHALRIYTNEEEYNLILASSELSGLSVSTFCRNVCLGSKVISREDAQARRELYKINSDLSRLGGLLKYAISEGYPALELRPLLKQIEARQQELKEKVKTL